MAMTPVPVKQSSLAPAGTPDVWRSFRTEMDRFFDQVANGFGMAPFRFPAALSMPSPAVDITETDTGFTVTAELPGMTEKDVQVSLSGATLTIKGEKRQDKEETKKDYHLTERSYGAFQRSFTLPDGVDGEKIAATFANGVLTVAMPKTAQAAPKTIEVKAAG